MSLNMQIYEEATDWVIKHREANLGHGDRKIFDEWLRASPQNVRAYLEMSSIWEDLPLLDRDLNPDVGGLVARARAENSVVSLGMSADRDIATRPRTTPPFNVRDAGTRGIFESPGRATISRLVYAFAAAALLVLGLAWFNLQGGMYATAIGEQRSLALSDGSSVQLNSRSRIKIRYSEGERRILLLEGQALFRVAKNPARPFIVQTGTTHIHAIGTTFDVNKTSQGAVVTVVEGRVAVNPARTAPQSSATVSVAEVEERYIEDDASVRVPRNIVLDAGEQIVIAPEAVQVPKLANVASATAWTQRRLVFEAAPLTTVAEEFNRYNSRPLMVENPELADFHVSGVFSSVEPGLFLTFLRAQPELIVQETDSEIRIRKR